MSKLLVTGATGFLGVHLVPKLIAGGHSVRAMARSAPPPALKDAEFLRGDLQDRELVRKALEGVDVLYHLAGLVSFRPKDAQKMYALHVDATRELLWDALAAGVKRIVLASTSGTIAVSKDERIGTEDDDYPITVVGQWPYYLSKIYEEKLALDFCRRHEIPLVVLNPSLLMGPGDDRLSSTWTVLKFLQKEIPALPSGGISIADVRDVADAFVSALTRGELYGRHLMGVNLTMSDFFGRLSRLSGVPVPMLRLSPKWNLLGAKVLEKWDEMRGLEPKLDPQEVDIGDHYFWLDPAKAERELGFKARDVHETLHDTVQDLYGRMAPGNLPGTKGKMEELRK